MGLKLVNIVAMLVSLRQATIMLSALTPASFDWSGTTLGFLKHEGDTYGSRILLSERRERIGHHQMAAPNLLLYLPDILSATMTAH